MYKFGDPEESREKKKFVCISLIKFACKILFFSFFRIFNTRFLFSISTFSCELRHSWSSGCSWVSPCVHHVWYTQDRILSLWQGVGRSRRHSHTPRRRQFISDTNIVLWASRWKKHTRYAGSFTKTKHQEFVVFPLVNQDSSLTLRPCHFNHWSFSLKRSLWILTPIQ